MEITKLANVTALRTYAIEKDLAEAVSQLVSQALAEDLIPDHISFECSDDFMQTGEYHIVLWAD
ncbi:hypothetical protein KKH23_09640 [Patescibacteria group bacterium]|nr:hypothetical protein [Patescibacteria group bacterium]